MNTECQKFSVGYSMEFMKLAAAVGSAGFAGCVALITSRTVEGSIKQLVAEAAWYFAASVFGTLIVAGLAYTAQLFYTEAAHRVQTLWAHPYYSDPKARTVLVWFGRGAQALGTIGAIGVTLLIGQAGLLILSTLSKP